VLRPGALSSEPLLLVEVSYEEGEVPSERHAAHSQSLTQALDRTCGYVHDLFVADPVRELMLESPARPKHGSRTLALNLLLPLRLPHRYRLLRYLLLLLRPAATATATATATASSVSQGDRPPSSTLASPTVAAPVSSKPAEVSQRNAHSPEETRRRSRRVSRRPPPAPVEHAEAVDSPKQGSVNQVELNFDALVDVTSSVNLNEDAPLLGSGGSEHEGCCASCIIA